VEKIIFHIWKYYCCQPWHFSVSG